MRGLSDRAVLGSTVGALVGGRWAISWVVYLINAPLNLVAIGSNAGSSTPGATWSAWLLVSVVGYLAFGVVLLLAHWTAFRARALRPVPMLFVVLLGLVAGGVRGLTVGVLAQSWELAPLSGVLVTTRVVTGAVLGAVLVPLAAFILASIDAYRTQRSALLTERRALQVLALRDEGVTQDLESALLASVQSDLAAVSRTQDPELAREVSRRIWSEGGDVMPVPRLHWASVLRASVERNPFATTPVAVIWALSSIGTLTAAIGLPRAAAQVAFSVAAIAIFFALGRAFVTQRPQSSLAAFVVTMAAVVILTGPVASVLFDDRAWPAGLSLVIVNSMWLPLLAVGAGFVVAVVRSSEDVLADLRDQVSDVEVGALAAHDERERLRRELATRLHGSVQSRLLAAAAAPTSGQFADGVLDDLVGAMENGEANETLDVRLARVARPWAALMQVQIDITGAAPSALDEAIVRVVEEGLANAYRHGRASQASVVIGPTGDRCRVVITDDGSGVAPGARPGLGSAVLDSLAPDSWALDTLPSGASLTVLLGFAHPR